MKVNVLMPKMGESITEGTVIKWHKKKGDSVKKDEIIFEISTDKVDTEIPSPANGILAEIKVFENQTVDVDTLVAVINTERNEIEEQAEEGQKIASSTTQIGGNVIEIPMPKMGESVMEGTIIKWHKKKGDSVKKDEIIFEISTDKVDTEVPSPEAGVLDEILVQETQTVSVGTIVAKLISSSGIFTPSKPETVVAAGKLVKSNMHTSEKLRKEKTELKNKSKFYSPLVLNIAAVENIEIDELENISGSGINGRVSKKDVLQYIEDKKLGKTKEKPSVKLYADTDKDKVTERDDATIIPMNNIRKRIMQHMKNSKDTSVHVTAIIEADMSNIHNFINANRDEFLKRYGIKLTYMPFISHACIKALQEFPLLNASIEDENIIVKKHINLGIAVAVEPNGLLVPNIKNADELSIKGLAKAINELSSKSRNKGLVPDDIIGGTFTITNYGVFGSLFGTPIINQPEVGILGVGAVTKKPVVIENKGSESIGIKPMMYLSLSHDHRLVDGMLGGKFLKRIKENLESLTFNI
ncbi:MAG: 2-oxoglutarate dehydrogenase, E2 component, dihydrolipoamide succinyltransferase [Bacteroidetes bacterium]|nr:2-oxoglutarate dehydrogenase, E2 component, dihydrolipoamide succinyltransferase [Bacteroidota bacterium]